MSRDAPRLLLSLLSRVAARRDHRRPLLGDRHAGSLAKHLLGHLRECVNRGITRRRGEAAVSPQHLPLADSRVRPSCSVTNVAPVTIAMSSRYDLRRSPGEETSEKRSPEGPERGWGGGCVAAHRRRAA